MSGFSKEERLLENEFSINLPARYHLKNKVRNSWINIINPFTAIMVLGTPGAGKSYFVIRQMAQALFLWCLKMQIYYLFCWSDYCKKKYSDKCISKPQVTYETKKTGRAIPKTGLADSANVDNFLNTMTTFHCEMNKEHYEKMGITKPALY